MDKNLNARNLKVAPTWNQGSRRLQPALNFSGSVGLDDMLKKKKYILYISSILLAGAVSGFIRNLDEEDYISLRQIINKAFTGAAPLPVKAPEKSAAAGRKPVKKKSKIIAASISGAVYNPGFYVAKNGSSLYTLLRLSGGVRGAADLTKIDLSRSLKDGEKVYIPFRRKKSLLEYFGFGKYSGGGGYLNDPMIITEEKAEYEGSDSSDIKIIRQR